MITNEKLLKLDFLVGTLSSKNNDVSFPRYMNGILTDEEYGMIDHDIYKYIKVLSDLKMLYLIMAFNIEFSLNSVGSHIERKQYEVFSEEFNSCVNVLLTSIYDFMLVYILFIIPQLNIEFPFRLEKFQTKDMRYIMLNLLNSNGTLVPLIELDCFPRINLTQTTSLHSLLTGGALLNDQSLNDIKNSYVNNLNLPIPNLDLEVFQIDNKYHTCANKLELINLSLKYINDFMFIYNKSTNYIEKFINIQCLIFVYLIYRSLCIRDFVVTEEFLYNQIINFMGVIFKMIYWFKNNLGYFKSKGDLPINKLLQIYSSSIFFIKAYDKFIEHFEDICYNLFISVEKNNYDINLIDTK